MCSRFKCSLGKLKGFHEKELELEFQLLELQERFCLPVSPDLIADYEKYSTTKPGMNKATKHSYAQKAKQCLEEIDLFFIKQCTKIAKSLENEEIPIVALVVKDFKVISMGINAIRFFKQPHKHAEILAISRACLALENFKLHECSLYVNLEPCAMCLSLMQEAQLKRVIFGAPSDKKGALGGAFNYQQLISSNWKVEVVPNILSEENEQLIKQFFTKLRK